MVQERTEKSPYSTYSKNRNLSAGRHFSHQIVQSNPGTTKFYK